MQVDRGLPLLTDVYGVMSVVLAYNQVKCLLKATGVHTFGDTVQLVDASANLFPVGNEGFHGYNFKVFVVRHVAKVDVLLLEHVSFSTSFPSADSSLDVLALFVLLEVDGGFSSLCKVSGDDFPGLPCVTEAVFDQMGFRALSVLVLNLLVSAVVSVEGACSLIDGSLS